MVASLSLQSPLTKTSEEELRAQLLAEVSNPYPSPSESVYQVTPGYSDESVSSQSPPPVTEVPSHPPESSVHSTYPSPSSSVSLDDNEDVLQLLICPSQTSEALG